MTETYNYGLRDLRGNPVPDSHLSPVNLDVLKSTGNYDQDVKKNVHAYSYENEERVLLSSVDLNKYIVKYIAGLWRIREKPHQSYKIQQVYDKRFILGEKIEIKERDDFGFEYYKAAEEHYDIFGVLTPNFNMFVAKCNTVMGPMLRYGVTREDARAFLRGEIFDVFAPQIVHIILGNGNQK